MKLSVCILGAIWTACAVTHTANSQGIIHYPKKPGEKAKMVEKLEMAKDLLDSVKHSIKQQIDEDNKDNSKKQGKCAEALANIVKPMPPGGTVPNCDENGNYKKMQCNGSTGYCWCVDVMTGRKVDGTSRPMWGVRPDCDKRQVVGKCAEALANIVRPMPPGGIAPSCDENGNYKKMQCGPRMRCWCVDVMTGQEVGGTSRPIWGRPYCDKTQVVGKCAEEFEKRKGSIGGYVPQCDANGDYKIVQCRLGPGYFYCWCAHRRSGERIAGTAEWTKEREDEKNRAHCLIGD